MRQRRSLLPMNRFLLPLTSHRRRKGDQLSSRVSSAETEERRQEGASTRNRGLENTSLLNISHEQYILLSEDPPRPPCNTPPSSRCTCQPQVHHHHRLPSNLNRGVVPRASAPLVPSFSALCLSPTPRPPPCFSRTVPLASAQPIPKAAAYASLPGESSQLPEGGHEEARAKSVMQGRVS